MVRIVAYGSEGLMLGAASRANWQGGEDEMEDRRAEWLMAALLLVFVFLISRRAGQMTAGQNVTVRAKQPVVVLDSGHGGWDPGKIGVDGSLEKDINLQVAKRLKKYLEGSDVTVVMTREDDRGLYGEKESRKKTADMKNRCQIINDAEPDLVVSIHQNSYHEEAISGGQVFYYQGSEQGEKLAQILQKRFDFVLGEKNTRQARANGSYYLLLHVKKPIVIVECGFLSNWREAAALASEEYQDRLAWTLHMGIMEYLNRIGS